MSEVSAFIGLVQTFKAAHDAMSALLKLRVSNEVSGKISELYKLLLIEAQGQALAAQSENAALVARIRELEEERTRAERQQSELVNYEMKQVGAGAFVYAVKEGHNGSAPPHWLCPTCFSNGHKSILQHDPNFSVGCEMYFCSRCNGSVSSDKGRFPDKA